MLLKRFGFFAIGLISFLILNCSSTSTEDICFEPQGNYIIEEINVLDDEEPLEEKSSETIEETIEEPVLVSIDIPTYTYAKTYEDGGLITNKTSQAYEWISKCDIDERGHYMYEDKYHAVAMGNYFDNVGSKYLVTFDSGKTIYVIKCDVKQDKHTTNQMIDGSGAMIEFIVDTEKASDYYWVGENGYILNGSFNNHDDFNGNIIKIEQII